MIGVIVLAVMLIAGIVSMMNSIPLSIRTIYSYSRHYTGVTPRGLTSEVPKIMERFEAESPVEIDRMIVARNSFTEVTSIVGGWPFVVLALTQDDMRYYVERMGGGEVDGRYPTEGEPGALISSPVARNLNLGIGDELLGPTNDEGYSAQSVKVTGILRSEEWVILCPIEYHTEHHFPPIDVLLVFAKNQADQAKLDRWAYEAFKGTRSRIFAYHLLEEDTAKMFSILYKILNIVIGTLVVVITIMMGMLMSIFQAQRMQEFGLLQALGWSRKILLRRSLMETALTVLIGWILGGVIAYAMLTLVKVQLMDPKAFAIDPLDKGAYLYTIPVPVAILVIGALTLVLRLKRSDPVSIVERRLV